jgi:Fur family ferric uptake transcriptional regulator
MSTENSDNHGHNYSHGHAKAVGLATMPNVRMTKGCKKVLQYLERTQDLTSAQDIHGLMRGEDNSAPGLTTVYRSLESLVGMGLVQAVDLGDGERRYELVPPGEHHHHLVCQQCQKSVHLDECLIEQFEDSIRASHGFQIRSHVLEIFGICRDCSGEGAQK